ncbi:MAG TPA: hypothetical protein VL179_14575 [Mycobacterium sp.]|nr:hypothetical protein [Mycobacterium sp.]
MEVVLAVVLLIVIGAVGLFIVNLFEAFTEGIVEAIWDAIVALVAMPFKYVTKRRKAQAEELAKAKLDSHIRGHYFETVVAGDRVYPALSAQLRKGELHPANTVTVETDEPGRHVFGVGWNEGVKFTMTDGSTRYGTGKPVLTAEVTYEQVGPRVVGRMRVIPFSRDRDWTDDAIMELLFPWCFEPILAMDARAQLFDQPPGPTVLPSAASAFPRSSWPAASPSAPVPGHPRGVLPVIAADAQPAARPAAELRPPAPPQRADPPDVSTAVLTSQHRPSPSATGVPTTVFAAPRPTPTGPPDATTAFATPSRPSPPVAALDASTTVFATSQPPPRIARLGTATKAEDKPGSEDGAGRFNAPPGWPQPAPGWSPPSEWRPDPSWPPAPPGWKFWVD